MGLACEFCHAINIVFKILVNPLISIIIMESYHILYGNACKSFYNKIKFAFY